MRLFPHLLWTAAAVAWSGIAYAHGDGATAFAVALRGICVDGDLSDWPAGMIEYPIRNHGRYYGPTDLDQADLDRSADLSPSFRVGYDRDEDLLLLAVRVRDDRLRVGGAHHKQTDACEVYVDGDHSGERGVFWPGADASGMVALQYVAIPGEGTYAPPEHKGNPSLFLGDLRRTRMAFARQGDTTSYEWAIEAFDHYPEAPTHLVPGRTIGFDVAVVDKDSDSDIPAWVCWGPFAGAKYLNADQLGDLVLVTSYAELAALSGRVTDARTGTARTGATVRVVDGQGMVRGRATAAADGSYRISVQPGSYQVTVAGGAGMGSRAAVVAAGEEVAIPDLTTAAPASDDRSERLDPTWLFKGGVGALLAFAFLHLFLFVFHPRLKENLYYAAFTSATAAGMYLNYRMDFVVAEQGAQWAHLRAFGLVSIFVILAGMRFLYALFSPRLPRQFWLFAALGVVTAGWFWPVVADGVPLLALVCLPEMLRVVVVSMYRRKDGAWIIGIGYLGFVLASAYQTLAGFNLLRSGVEYTYVYGFLGLLACVSVYLARSIARTNQHLAEQVVQIRELSAHQLEQERRIRAEEVERQLLEDQLQTAHNMQMALMPRTPPAVPGWDIAGRCQPATHVGGDFYQYYRREGCLSVCLADATGHAMEAAIPAVMFGGVLRTQMELHSSVDTLLVRLNRSLHGSLGEHTFICLTVGEVDLAHRTLRLANSGCPYPYHYRAATSDVVELRVDAYPLGVRPDTTYPVIEVGLEPGDRVVFCSDGVVEAANDHRELFGFERTAEAIRQGCQAGLAAEGLLERVMSEVTAFRGQVPQGDDQTVVVVQVAP